jgi:hypothetical protein
MNVPKIAQCFAEKILHGFGFGVGMGSAFTILGSKETAIKTTINVDMPPGVEPTSSQGFKKPPFPHTK